MTAICQLAIDDLKNAMQGGRYQHTAFTRVK
jgi:hypothetical protein